MARVVIENLTKIFKGPKNASIPAVSGLSLTVEDGELLALVGPSGCGKTTALRLIAGLEAPTEGTISIDGKAVTDAAPKDRDIAMVFQHHALYPHMTVFENLAFGLKLRKHPREEIEQRVREAAGILGLTDCLGRRPEALSGGQRQRVAVGRAMVRRPKVFLFDEPLSNLDAQLRDEMRREIKRLHQELGKTMIYVTHDQIEAMTMADRIVLLRDGSIEQAGAPLELFERPATKYVAGFLGSPSMNFLDGRLVSAAESLAVRLEDGTLLPLPPARGAKLAGRRDQSVTLGLRPEHMSRAHTGDARSGLVRQSVAIELLQPTGSRTYATFKLGTREVVAELQAHDVTQINQTLDLSIDMNRAVLIDPATEKVL